MSVSKEEWLYKQFHDLDEFAQINFLDRLMSESNKAKLRQKRQDITKTTDVHELKDKAQELIDNWGQPLGLMSEYENLNVFCGGFRRRGVYIIGGDASSGKSTFAINLISHFDQQAKKVHVVSYEDPSEFVTARISMILGGVEGSTITFPAPELVEGIYSMEHNRLYEHLAGIKKKHGLDVVMIDYIQFMALFAEENEYVAINNTMKLFRDIAKSLDIVLIGLSQLNRGKEITQSRFHGSGAIEKLADVAMIIDKDLRFPDELKIQVVKSKYTWLRQQRIVYAYDPEKKGALFVEREVVEIDTT